MKILVTGGSGFLGKALVRALIQRGHTVSTLCRRPDDELDATGATTHLGDLGDAEVVRRAITGCDAVFHVAAKVGAGGRARSTAAAAVRSGVSRARTRGTSSR